MSQTAQSFRNLYIRGLITKGAVIQAVKDGVLTEEEYAYVTGELYPEEQ